MTSGPEVVVLILFKRVQNIETFFFSLRKVFEAELTMAELFLGKAISFFGFFNFGFFSRWRRKKIGLHFLSESAMLVTSWWKRRGAEKRSKKSRPKKAENGRIERRIKNYLKLYWRKIWGFLCKVKKLWWCGSKRYHTNDMKIKSSA